MDTDNNRGLTWDGEQVEVGKGRKGGTNCNSINKKITKTKKKSEACENPFSYLRVLQVKGE